MKRFLFAVVIILVPKLSVGATIFESGTLGPTGIYVNEIGGGTAPGGAVISPFVLMACVLS